MKTVTILILGVLTISRPSATASTLQFGDQDLLGMGSYASDPTRGAILEGLAPGQVTVASLRTGHTWPFSPSPEDFPGTDQIYIGSMQTRSGDGYSRAAELVRGPQVLVLDYSSLIPSGQAVETLTLGIAPDDFQMPQFGNPYTATVNGIDDVALTAHLNSIHLWTSVEFFTIGIDPSVLNRSHILTISIDQIEQPSPDGRGGDGWAIDFLTVGVTTQTTWHVDDDAQLGGDGATWSTAFKYLQDALAAASTGAEIHVAAGVYTPDRDEAGTLTPGNRGATFQLVNGVELRGGYAGLANPDNPEEWNTGLHRTVLTGDLYGNDGPGFAHNEENSLHVVTGSGANESAVLAGFTITAGHANAACPNCVGGGLFNSGGSPTVLNCIFTGNTAESGAGMANWNGSSPTVTDCAFTGNEVLLFAGGMDNYDASSPTVRNCTFNGNSADSGGAMVISWGSAPTLDNCTFVGNTAGSNGGGIYTTHSNPALTSCTFSENSATLDGGGMFNLESSPMVANCTFRGNMAAWGGGGMFNRNSSDPTVTNCTFTGNTAAGDFYSSGGGMYSDHSSPTVANCTFAENRADYGGGGMYSWVSAPVVTNCTFRKNTADWGGGGLFSESSYRPVVTNCTFSSNLAPNGKAIACDSPYGSPSTVQLTNCILWNGGEEIWNNDGSTITIAFSDVHGGWANDDCPVQYPDCNTDLPPMFVDIDGPDGILGTEDDNLRLSPGSPCIDAGNPGFVPEPGETDLDGHVRVLCRHVDMGSYEFGIGDFDCSGSLDLKDFGALQRCLTGSDGGPYAAGCESVDFEYDNDVDLDDYAAFHEALP